MLENANPKYILEASIWASATFFAILVFRFYFPSTGNLYLKEE